MKIRRPLAALGSNLALALLSVSALFAQEMGTERRVNSGPFDRFDLPDDWEARFWADPGTKALLRLEPKAWADLVPQQAGLRYCRCPGCDAPEADDPLVWSAVTPDVLTCRRCGLVVPNEKVPAPDKDTKKPPEETVEVLPRIIHHYPYHAVEPEKQFYPDERLYLAAKRDDAARRFLSKAALYASVRYHEQDPPASDPGLARLAAVLVLRFAQVYPAYATHYDQLGQPKYLQRADLPPPYRRGYRTGKWDSTSNLDVPLNLVIAYALIRDTPAVAEAGRLLGVADPVLTIQRDLLRASAEFVRLQPEEFNEMSLAGYRGMLAVGRVLDDDKLVRESLGRLSAFAERGFYHDGFWRQADASAHQRIVGLIDGWIERLLLEPEPATFAGGTVPKAELRAASTRSADQVPMLSLARGASSAILSDVSGPEIQRVAWPATGAEAVPRHPALLGGAGLSRLALGQGAEALDLDLRSLDGRGGPHFQRLAIRLAVAGRTILGDLDDLPPTVNGWDRATASHNTIVVDGLNQRESVARAQAPAPAGRFLFFAAENDFQVVSLDDPGAYPQSTTRYRQTVIASTSASGRARYALSVFEVHGGLQHDQFFHAAPGLGNDIGPGPGTGVGPTPFWQFPSSVRLTPLRPMEETLLPPSITYVPDAHAEDGRWFVQGYGELALQARGPIPGPTTALLARSDGLGVRLHLLSAVPMTAYLATSPEPMTATVTEPGEAPIRSRAGLILRRHSDSGETLKSTFVTLFEPVVGPGPPSANTLPLTRVGRVGSGPETVVILIETVEGSEHLVVNLAPGTVQSARLADGRTLRTDGLAVRVRGTDLTLAGGTFASLDADREGHGPDLRQSLVSGRIIAVTRGGSASGRGWFLADAPVPEPESLAGRILLIKHGDGTIRGWTVTRAENTPDGRAARLHVHEEPGFLIDSYSGIARYYQFPRDTFKAPHTYQICKIARLALAGQAASKASEKKVDLIDKPRRRG